MVVRESVRVEQIDEEPILVDPAARDVRIWKVLVDHCAPVKTDQLIDHHIIKFILQRHVKNPDPK